MEQLTALEIHEVAGGKCEPRAYDLVKCPSSEKGKEANDLANVLGEIGSWIGLTIYDLTH
jgi:hypothetical protein